MTTTALPGGRNCRHRRLRTQWNRRGQARGTLMRHFLRFGPIPALAFGVRMTASPARLIAATGGLNGGVSCLIGTPGGAVAMTPITVTANDHGRAATRTQVAPSWEIHGQRGPMGGRQQARFVKYSACDVARQGSGARHRNWLGRWRRCRAGISTGRGAFTASAAQALLPPPTPPSPVLPHFVCQTAVCAANRPPGALRAAG